MPYRPRVPRKARLSPAIHPSQGALRRIVTVWWSKIFKTVNNMNRGSEWRQWDLHVHTPETAKNNQFGNADEAWPKYISILNSSEIAVFGITDYFSIKNYLKVKQYQKDGILVNKTIIPNVELRIEPVTGKGTPINIHAIFDPDLTEDEINREFFRCLKFRYDNSEYSCCENDLRDLGRVLKNDPEYPEQAAIKAAINEIVISYVDLRAVLEKPFFKNRVIIALSNSSNDGNSGLYKQEGGLVAVRSEIYKMVDVILSGNPNDVRYFLGETTSVEEVIRNCGSLKPCITGSDAHCLEKVGVFTEGRATWVKADPSFEGLKQILFEPKERVMINETRPDNKYDYDIIDHVELNLANTWSQTLYFNQNLNTIIGGRSTGKSTLLASIAASFDCVDDVDNKEYIHTLTDSIHVVWRDGQESRDKYIEYFPQNKISKLSEPQETDKLLLSILLGKTDIKKSYDEHKATLAAQYSAIQTQVSLYFEKRRLFTEKKQAVKGIGDEKGIELEISKLVAARNENQSKLTDKKDLLDSYIKDAEEISKLINQKGLLTKEIERLQYLSQQNFAILNNSITLSDLQSDQISRIAEKTKNEIGVANTKIQTFIKEIIAEDNNKILSINKHILEIQNKPDYIGGKQVFDTNKQLTVIIQQLDELNKKLLSIKQENKTLQKLLEECKSIGQSLLEMHKSYLDEMNKIASIMRLQYEDVSLTSTIILKPAFIQTLNECISLRSNAMNDLVQNTLAGFRKLTKFDIVESLKKILNEALTGNIPFKGGYEVQSFVSKLLAECWYDITLNVEYDGDNLKDMSPGKRSFVVLKLLFDFSDKKCPIMIDQPEDNLDNRAIYSELVKYIRRKKKERQIILVTHNPNIVVGADSEEVIIANQNGKNSPNAGKIKFQYLVGSLENSKQRTDAQTVPMLERCGIREHVCDILEGGENAFRDRENKYGFFKI